MVHVTAHSTRCTWSMLLHIVPGVNSNIVPDTHGVSGVSGILYVIYSNW